MNRDRLINIKVNSLHQNISRRDHVPYVKEKKNKHDYAELLNM